MLESITSKRKSGKKIEASQNKEVKKKHFKVSGSHIKTAVTLAFVALVCVAVYSDWQKNGSAVNNTDYLYTANYDNTDESKSSKILGEAALVDSPSPENSPITAVSEKSKDVYFSDASADRARKRDEALQTLQTVIDSSETMPDVKDKALTEMISIADDIETEANVESLIKAKGFEDCLAVISGANINIVVKTSGLLTNEVAQIREIAMNETGKAAENIVIIEKN